jgi:hypothetical protein
MAAIAPSTKTQATACGAVIASLKARRPTANKVGTVVDEHLPDLPAFCADQSPPLGLSVTAYQIARQSRLPAPSGRRTKVLGFRRLNTKTNSLRRSA